MLTIFLFFYKNKRLLSFKQLHHCFQSAILLSVRHLEQRFQEKRFKNMSRKNLDESLFLRDIFNYFCEIFMSKVSLNAFDKDCVMPFCPSVSLISFINNNSLNLILCIHLNSSKKSNTNLSSRINHEDMLIDPIHQLAQAHVAKPSYLFNHCSTFQLEES